MQRFSRGWRDSRNSRNSSGAAGDDAEGDDDDVDAAIARNLWKNHRLIPPNSTFLKYWFAMIICLVLYNAIYIPIELCFDANQLGEKNPAHVGIDFFVDFLFLTDVAINFRTVYYNDDFEMVLDVKMIKRRYMRGWFWLDFFASLPYDVISIGLTLSALEFSTSELGTLGLLKLPRLLRLGKLLKKLDQMSGATAVRILVVVFGFILIGHWLACIWWLIGISEYRAWEVQTQRGAVDFGTPWVLRVPNSAPLGPWSTLDHAYLSSLYWALTTLMKSPMVGPDTIVEKIFSCVAVAIGAILFAVLLTFVSSLTRQSQSHSAEKREALSRLGKLSKHYNVVPSDTKRMVSQAEALWTVSSGLNDNKILAQLPSQLRSSILKHMHADVLTYSSLFGKVSLECSVNLLAKMKTEVVLLKEPLVRQGENLDQVYMLIRGALSVSAPAGGANSGRDSEADGGGSPPPKMPKCCGGGGGGADSPGNGSSPNARASKSSKMGMHGGEQLVERPGACIGGAYLFSDDVDIYGFDVVSSRSKTTVLGIRKVDLQNVLTVFGKEDAEVCATQLKGEHKRLVDSLLGAAKRRSSLQSRGSQGPAATSSTTADGESTTADEQGAVSNARMSMRKSRAMSMQRDSAAGDAQGSSEEEAKKREERKEKAKKDAEEATGLLMRVSELETAVTQCVEQLDAVTGNLKPMPKILNLLLEQGVIAPSPRMPTA